MDKVTKTQIAAWKEQYGSIYAITVAKKTAYFKPPDRQIMGFAMAQSTKNPLAVLEALAKNCWLAGDKALLEDDVLFFSLATRLQSLVELKEATLKKL